MCGLRYPACKSRAPYCHQWLAPLYKLSPHYLKNRTIFEKQLQNTKCVLISSTNLSETFFLLRRIEWDMFKKKSSGLRVKYRLLLSGFNETLVFSQVFRKILKYQNSWKSVQWEPSCFMRSDSHDEANSRVSQFCERAKKLYLCYTKFCLLLQGQMETILCVVERAGELISYWLYESASVLMWTFINQDDSQNVIYDLNIDPLELRHYALSNMKIDVDIKRRVLEDRGFCCCSHCCFSFNYVGTDIS
jgi:hypothetical protein